MDHDNNSLLCTATVLSTSTAFFGFPALSLMFLVNGSSTTRHDDDVKALSELVGGSDSILRCVCFV
jgi:hypothetical protein